jgi:hypothetical protein
MSFSNKKKKLNYSKSENLIKLNEASNNISNAFKELDSKNINYVLLGSYPDFPNFIYGSDIDLYTTEPLLVEGILRDFGFLIRKYNSYEFRAFLYISSTGKWIFIDIESKKSYNPNAKSILLSAIENKIKNTENGCFFASIPDLVAYKYYKYIVCGFIHSEYQIKKLSKLWNGCTDKEIEQITSLIELTITDRLQEKALKEFSLGYGKNLIKDESFLKCIDNLRQGRHDKRLVYGGRVNKKALIKKVRFIFGLFLFSRYKVNSAMPIIAIVGNDGSGKTTLIENVLQDIYKMDPLHIVMRADESWLPGWTRTRVRLLSIVCDFREKNRFLFLNWIFKWLGEVSDYMDRWVKYKVGQSYAKSGFGPILFERYPTDRLRGEYPGPRLSLFPLEQFFPMPGLVVLLDVEEEKSLERKADDGHTYLEMNEKRKNYLRLIGEITPSVTIQVSNLSIEEARVRLNKIIFDECKRIQSSNTPWANMNASWNPKKSKDCYVKGRFRQKKGFY